MTRPARVTRALLRAGVATVAAAALVGGVLALAPSGHRASGLEEYYPFDDVPGLGQSSAAAMRDDTIAYWEAWRRDVVTAQCMTQHGHTWHPEALFPGYAVMEIADHLGVLPIEGTADPEALNEAYRDNLTVAQLDSYYQALYGETYDAITYSKTNGGAVPDGRPDFTFASGGCTGSALAQVGTIWALRRNLAVDLAQLQRDARATAEYAAVLSADRTCALARSGELIANSTGAGQVVAPGTAGDGCDDLWRIADAEGHKVVDSPFAQAHALEFSTQSSRYAYAPDAIAQDTEFLTYLANAAGRAWTAFHSP